MCVTQFRLFLKKTGSILWKSGKIYASTTTMILTTGRGVNNCRGGAGVVSLHQVQEKKGDEFAF